MELFIYTWGYADSRPSGLQRSSGIERSGVLAMNQEVRHRVTSILENSEIEIGLCLGAGLRGISQSTWQKISARMEPSDAGKGLFHLRVASVELRLSDGCVLSGAEVRQLLNLCGGFAPLYVLNPEN